VRAGKETLVLGFPEYGVPARSMAKAAGLDYDEVRIHSFPDGESRVRLPAVLPSRVVLCLTLDDPDRKLVTLELAAATARQLGATSLTLVAPYLCYMRQDAAFHPGEAVSQRIIGEVLARRFDAVITVDPHLHRTPRLERAVPVARAVSLTAAPALAQWLSLHERATLVVGPDEESEQWVRAVASPAGLEYVVCRKRRLGDREVEVQVPEGSFTDRRVVIVDDVASTGQTLAAAARQLQARGAAEISVAVTHALFVDGAIERLRAAGVTDICSTDSILHPTNRVHLAELLARALFEP
jgi:ribose-phosphate pyrophosphokinase